MDWCGELFWIEPYGVQVLADQAALFEQRALEICC
jgi:hypothetical protein